MLSFQQHNEYGQLKSANRSQALKAFKEEELRHWSEAGLGSKFSSTCLPTNFALIFCNIPLFFF